MKQYLLTGQAIFTMQGTLQYRNNGPQKPHAAACPDAPNGNLNLGNGNPGLDDR